MIDIQTLFNGGEVINSDIYKAENLLLTQQGSLYFNPDFGIDMALFFNQNFDIQFETFVSYINNVMVANNIDILSLNVGIDKFASEIILKIGGESYGV